MTHSVSSVTYLLICSACLGAGLNWHLLWLQPPSGCSASVFAWRGMGGQRCVCNKILPQVAPSYRITVFTATLQLPVRPSSLILAFMCATADRALLLEAKAAWKDPYNVLANWISTTCPCGNVSTFNSTNNPPSAWQGVEGCEGGQMTHLCVRPSAAFACTMLCLFVLLVWPAGCQWSSHVCGAHVPQVLMASAKAVRQSSGVVRAGRQWGWQQHAALQCRQHCRDMIDTPDTTCWWIAVGGVHASPHCQLHHNVGYFIG